MVLGLPDLTGALRFFIYFFCSVMVQFKLLKSNYSNQTTLRANLWGFQTIHKVKKYTMDQRSNSRNFINNYGYLPLLELLQLCDIHTVN